MDQFCGGPSHEEYGASSYRHWVKPLVERAIIGLENEIDNLKLEVEKLKAAKPKLRFNSALGIWYVVPKTGEVE